METLVGACLFGFVFLKEPAETDQVFLNVDIAFAKRFLLFEEESLLLFKVVLLDFEGLVDFVHFPAFFQQLGRRRDLVEFEFGLQVIEIIELLYFIVVFFLFNA